jgi:O-antigen ligase
MGAHSVPAGLPGAWTARRPSLARGARAASLPAAAVVLGAGVGLGSLPLMVLALVPLAAAAVLKPDGAVVVFAGGFYLNLAVVLVHQAGAPSALASGLAALLLLPFFGYVVMGRQPFVVTPALGLMVAYLAVLVLSGTLAPGAGPQTTSEITGFITEGLLLYVLITNAIRTGRTLRLVLWAVAAAAGLMGLISLWQELTHSYGNHLMGLAQIDQTGFDVGTAGGGKSLRPRLAGPIGEKNRYAQVLIVVLPLCVYLARTEGRRILRWAAAAAGALALCGMMLTFSRGAAIALVATLVVAAALGIVRARYVAALLIGAVGLTLLVAPDYLSRVQSLSAADSALSNNTSADAAVVGRATENLAALHAFADHPVLGVGPGQYFRQYSQEYANQLNLRFLENNRRAHNLYLEIAADTGAVGLAAFLAVVGATLLGLWRMSTLWRHRHPPHAYLAQAMILALVAYLASGAFLQLSYQRYFFFLVALANAAIWILRREAIRARII